MARDAQDGPRTANEPPLVSIGPGGIGHPDSIERFPEGSVVRSLGSVNPRHAAVDLVGRSCRIGTDWDGVIAGVSVGVTGSIQYEVVWWDGSSRKREWVARDEFALKSVAGAAGGDS